MSKLTLAAVAAAAVMVAMPVASEAGHMRAHGARASCPLTAMLHRDRAPRVAAAVHVAPRVHVRRERPEWLKRLFHRGHGHKR